MHLPTKNVYAKHYQSGHSQFCVTLRMYEYLKYYLMIFFKKLNVCIRCTVKINNKQTHLTLQGVSGFKKIQNTFELQSTQNHYHQWGIETTLAVHFSLQ